MSVEGEGKSVFLVEAYREKQQGVAGSEAFLGAEEEAEHPAGQRRGGEARLGQSWETKGSVLWHL